MGKVTVVGGKVGMEAPSNFDPVFANNDWATIIETVQKNKVPDTWMVGDQKTMTINGTDYLIDIIGKNHDVYSDGSGTAPLTFQMHDCYGTRIVMHSSDTNSVGWSECTMRTTHLPTIFTLMPVEVQVGIKAVNKLTSKGATSSTIITTEDKLFLLSEIEILGYKHNTHAGEGVQYAYYAAGNSKIKNLGTGAWHWWLRSPYAANSSSYCRVSYQGEILPVAYPSTDHGAAFAFCF